jgi:DNA polymerase-1
VDPVTGIEALPAPGDPDAVYCFDLNGFIWRLASSPFMAGKAALGFARTLRRILRERRPGYLAVAVDNALPTFRHDLFRQHSAMLGAEDYKADRVKRIKPHERAAVLEQIRTAQELLEDAYGVRCLAARGYEGDDVLATLAQRGLDAGLKVVVVAYDKDMFQLVQQDRCWVWDGEGRVFDAAAVEAKLGCAPDRVVDFMSIVGDSTDGVRGVVGAGPVAALKVLAAFPTLDAALESAERGDQDHPLWQQDPRLWAKVVSQQRQAQLCRQLVTLARDVPLAVTLQELSLSASMAVELALQDTTASEADPVDGPEAFEWSVADV